METCANCGVQLSDSEPAHVWSDNVVCRRCRDSFERQSSGVAPSMPPPLNTSRMVGQSGSAWLKGLAIAGAICVGSMVLMCGFLAWIGSDGKSDSLSPAPLATASSHAAGLGSTSPGMVYEALRARGYSVEKDLSDGGLTVICVKQINMTRYLVEIYGSATSVQRINMAVTTTIDKDANAIAAPEMAFVSTVQYEGALPDEAAAWVRANVGKNSSKSFGGAQFELRAPSPNGRLLTIK